MRAIGGARVWCGAGARAVWQAARGLHELLKRDGVAIDVAGARARVAASNCAQHARRELGAKAHAR